jgi:hypothetical protein
VLGEKVTVALPDPDAYPSLEALALMTNVPGVSDENEASNLPLKSVVPDVPFSDPPSQLSVSEVPETGFPSQVTVAIRVEAWSVVILPGLERIMMLS